MEPTGATSSPWYLMKENTPCELLSVRPSGCPVRASLSRPVSLPVVLLTFHFLWGFDVSLKKKKLQHVYLCVYSADVSHKQQHGAYTMWQRLLTSVCVLMMISSTWSRLTLLTPLQLQGFHSGFWRKQTFSCLGEQWGKEWSFSAGLRLPAVHHPHCGDLSCFCTNWRISPPPPSISPGGNLMWTLGLIKPFKNLLCNFTNTSTVAQIY